MKNYFYRFLIVVISFPAIFFLSSFCGGGGSIHVPDFRVSYIQLTPYTGGTMGLNIIGYPDLVFALNRMKDAQNVEDGAGLVYQINQENHFMYVEGWGAGSGRICGDDQYRDEIDTNESAFFYSQDFNLSGTQTVQLISQCHGGHGVYTKGSKSFFPQQWPVAGAQNPIKMDRYFVTHNCIDDDGEYGCFKDHQ